MYLKIQNLYHPYTNESFGFVASDNTNINILKGETLKDINLYHQPLHIPWIAILFSGIKLILLIAGEYLQIKVYKLMKKQKGILKRVTQTFVITQMIFWPFLFFFSGSTDFFHPMNELVGQWYCSIGSFFFWFLAYIILSHSFVAAAMRYFFILHREKVDKYGKERVQQVFLALSIGIPLFMATWDELEGTKLDAMSFINKCNGKHHLVFLIESSTINVAKRNFCAFEDYGATEVASRIMALLRQCSCVTSKIVQLLIGFNITEGFLYYKIFSHVNRYIGKISQRRYQHLYILYFCMMYL